MLALVTEAYGGTGGIAQYNRDLLDALAAAPSLFDAIDVLPRLAATSTSFPRPSMRQLPASKGRAAYSVRALQNALMTRPSVVFCGHLYMAPLALLAAKAAKARLVIQLHGIEVWNRPSPAQRKALEAADMITCVSRHTRACVCSMAAIAPERVVVISNTVGDQYAPGDRTAARARFGISESDFVLLSVGRLDKRERYKGHDLVFAELARQQAPASRNLRYLVAGDGDDQEYLETSARALGVLNRTCFLGQVERSLLPDLYRAADLFVLPSKGEGFGIVFLEAMACDTPAIGLAVGGASDALGDGELGWCVQTADFSDALRQAISSPCPTPDVLSAKVRGRFGSSVFRARAGEVFARMQ